MNSLSGAGNSDRALSFVIAAVVVYFVIVVPVSRALKLFQKDQAATEQPQSVG